jgi:hypothetical protein
VRRLFHNHDNFAKSRLSVGLSFLRKQESSIFKQFWTPIFTGVTARGVLTTASILTVLSLGMPFLYGRSSAGAVKASAGIGIRDPVIGLAALQ